jgi:hypothetical protein
MLSQMSDISFNECNGGTNQKLPFAVNTTIELKNLTATSNNTRHTCHLKNIPLDAVIVGVVVTFLGLVAQHFWYICLLGRAIAGISYGRFIAISYKFNLSKSNGFFTYHQV